MKAIFTLLTLSLLSLAGGETSIHDFKIKALNSDTEIDLSQYKGKKILVVNVASKCGYTPQYKDLQQLYSTYSDQLVVVGFPCDQFMGQELDTEAEIVEFCSSKFSVTFPLTTIINVKGKDQHPIYSWLTEKDQNGVGDYKISWNFNKFLLDENGKLIEYFPSSVNPLDDKIVNYLN